MCRIPVRIKNQPDTVRTIITSLSASQKHSSCSLIFNVNTISFRVPSSSGVFLFFFFVLVRKRIQQNSKRSNLYFSSSMSIPNVFNVSTDICQSEAGVGNTRHNHLMYTTRVYTVQLIVQLSRELKRWVVCYRSRRKIKLYRLYSSSLFLSYNLFYVNICDTYSSSYEKKMNSIRICVHLCFFKSTNRFCSIKTYSQVTKVMFFEFSI